MSKVAAFYDRFDEDSRLSKRRAGQLEFLMTKEVIEGHLSANEALLDLGAGAGAYSIHFAKKGISVTSVELSSGLVDIMERKRIEQNLKNLTVIQGSADNLEFLNTKFTTILCLGPYYHLKDNIKRKLCLAEIHRLLDTEGTVFLAYLNRHFAISYYQRNGVFLDADTLKDLLNNGFASKPQTDEFLNVTYFSDPNEVETEIEEAGFQVIDHLGIDGPHLLYFDSLEKMNEDEWEKFIDYHRSICRHPSIRGFSSHGLISFKKK